MNEFEQFLETDFEYADKTFRQFLKDVLVDALDAKRIGGADSGWQTALFEYLSIIDPKVVDPNLVKARDKAFDEDDWDRADELEGKIYREMDRERAEEAFSSLVHYLLDPR